MSNELTNDQRIRVLGMYLHSDVVMVESNQELLKTTGRNKGSIQKLTSSLFFNVAIWRHTFKLLLTPLSKITDEDSVQVMNIVHGVKNWGKSEGRKIITELYEKRRLIYTTTYLFLEVHQFLIQRGYAVPLFISIGHPLNGKTAIELGLAADATLINYKAETK